MISQVVVAATTENPRLRRTMNRTNDAPHKKQRKFFMVGGVRGSSEDYGKK